MHYVIVDLEATCWEGRAPSRNEIIEIGAVLVNDACETISEFEQFVQPVQQPILSNFCKELTTIRQQDVDNAPPFPEALKRFQQWFGMGHTPYLLCSWGLYDRNQFASDCKAHMLSKDWLAPHISLKHQYEAIAAMNRKVGLKHALEREGFTLDGTHHRGIDDARNISKIFAKYFERWQRP